ncbi:MAG: hypothetical protein ABWY20_14410 [Mycobacterium sp.]
MARLPIFTWPGPLAVAVYRGRDAAHHEEVEGVDPADALVSQRSPARTLPTDDASVGCCWAWCSARTAMDPAGHSTIEMTMNVRGHVTLGEKRDALNRLGCLFQEGK